MNRFLKQVIALCLMLCVAVSGVLYFYPNRIIPTQGIIQWADFDVPVRALQKAGQADIDTFQSENHVDWVESLACLAVKYGGNWRQYKGKDLDQIIEKAKKGTTPKKQAKSNEKNYNYFETIYRAVLGGFIGEYQHEAVEENGQSTIITDYGVKAFSPIAGGYGYSHYDDFGAGRSYGFRRNHLGNDLLGSVGTPIIAVESGTIEAMGWNQYGGWRIGIRSLDKKRYYYYAHLRSGHPYVLTLLVGDKVIAGDVIGYLGMTGYSSTEDTNGMTKPHLHFGMQLIFDESQKECDNEIWIDVYEIVKFLWKHRSSVQKNDKTGEFERKEAYQDLSMEKVD